MKTVESNLFQKNERLRLKEDIYRLFASGQSFVCYPLRIVYMPVTKGNISEPSMLILVSVPKKNIKHAVKRNRIKRLIRESYRLNKKASTDQCKQNGKHLHVAFLYLSNEMKTYDNIEKAMCKALDKILLKI